MPIRNMKNTVSQIQRRRAQEAGLTLIELLVVLAVLIALAGIVVPQLPNMLTRSHSAAASTNIPELNKTVQSFEQIYFKQPSNLDNLATDGALVAYLPGAGAGLSTITLTADTTAALTSAGISQLAGLEADASGVGATFSPTVNPYLVGEDVNLSATDDAVVAGVPLAQIQAKVRPGAVDGDVYAIFGIGQKSELIGRTVSEAPIHFSDEAGQDAGTVYSRFGAIYKIANTAGALEKAEFVSVVAIHDDGIETAADVNGEFFAANRLN
jgi:Tfp pilus assembly protein PilE